MSISVLSSRPTRSSSAVRAFSSRSAILRAVMSRLMPKVPMIRPSKSRSGCLLALSVSSSGVSGPQVRFLEVGDRQAGAHDGLLGGERGGGVLGGEVVADRLADHAGRVGAAELRGARADPQEAGLAVLEEDHVGAGRQQVVQADPVQLGLVDRPVRALGSVGWTRLRGARPAIGSHRLKPARGLSRLGPAPDAVRPAAPAPRPAATAPGSLFRPRALPHSSSMRLLPASGM